MRNRLSCLKALAVETIRNCTFVKDAFYLGERAPRALLLPSGDEKYFAFWVRDAAMMIESGLVGREQIRLCIEITAQNGQNGEKTLFLQNGLIVPPFAVCDHINYNGKPVYFPGTYSDGADQGSGKWGTYPPFCDNFYFIIMVFHYLKQGGNRDILLSDQAGFSLEVRLKKAYACYNTDPATGLLQSDGDCHTVDWGFRDSVKMSGKVLFASLLKYRAAQCMAEIFPQEKSFYAAEADKLSANILECFYDENSGLLFSSTGPERQHDVFGTAYAVFLEVLREKKTYEKLAECYKNGTAGHDGYIRQILTAEDWSATTAWAHCSEPYNTYQNGGYWATPLGWYIYAAGLADRAFADRLADEFLGHTEKFADAGAPFEFIGRENTEWSGCRYGTSGVLPYIGYKKLAERGAG